MSILGKINVMRFSLFLTNSYLNHKEYNRVLYICETNFLSMLSVKDQLNLIKNIYRKYATIKMIVHPDIYLLILFCLNLNRYAKSSGGMDL